RRRDRRGNLRRHADLRGEQRGRPDSRLRAHPARRGARLRAVGPARLSAHRGGGVMLAATVVEWDQLFQVVYSSLGAALGVTLAFSLAVAGFTRFAEARR